LLRFSPDGYDPYTHIFSLVLSLSLTLSVASVISPPLPSVCVPFGSELLTSGGGGDGGAMALNGGGRKEKGTDGYARNGRWEEGKTRKGEYGTG